MKTVYISRKENFNAAHKLWNSKWSDEKNEAVFGKCANKNWHGHNYDVIVTVKGIPSEDTGFVIDLKDLSQIISKFIIKPLDHKNLNLDVPFLEGLLPSTENVIIKIWEQIELPIKELGGELAKIKLEETENNFVEYFGGKEPF
ncbi:MAG: 6-carboxytetrahydropterin synthase [Crocinitomicaceae bacterium]